MFSLFYISVRIGGGLLVGEIADFATKVSHMEQAEKENQKALEDCPDEFLDPIMSRLNLFNKSKNIFIYFQLLSKMLQNISNFIADICINLFCVRYAYDRPGSSAIIPCHGR